MCVVVYYILSFPKVGSSLRFRSESVDDFLRWTRDVSVYIDLAEARKSFVFHCQRNAAGIHIARTVRSQ